MDCSLAAQQQKQLLLQHHLLQHQQHQQQQKQNSVNCLVENLKNHTSCAGVVDVVVVGGGSNNNHSSIIVSSSSNSVSPGKGITATAATTATGVGGAPVVVARSAAPSASASTAIKLRRHSERCPTTPEAKSHTYRISMANLEDTQESELDLILGELSLLEAQINCGDAMFLAGAGVGSDAAALVTATRAPPPSTGGGIGHMAKAQNVMSTALSTTTTTSTPVVNSNSSSTASSRTHSRTNSTISGATTIFSSDANSTCSSSGVSENGCLPVSGSLANASLTPAGNLVAVGVANVSNCSSGGYSGSTSASGVNMLVREPRTESPDNDSAFSDTVSLLSSESSASSSTSSALQQRQLQQQQHQQHQQHQHLHQHYQQQLYVASNMTAMGGMAVADVPSSNNASKAAKIQLALHKLESASIRRLFVKAFTSDGASKSLLVDERMTCGHVTRLLADKNHVQMQPNWALVENLGDLQMERLFEDHELLVDNLMTWNSDAGNRVLFQQRADKLALYAKPELYLPGPQMAPGCQHDEHTRSMLLEEFFETNPQLQVDGPLYMKADSKKGWKRYHFVLRSSGLYYFPKEKTKNTRDLACLTLFNGYNVYYGIGWKKKCKSPTDYTFGFKSAVDSSLGKSCRTLKMLCAEDLETMEKWLTAIRISKYGKQLWENHKALMDDLVLCGGGGDGLSQRSGFAVAMRSESISSISSTMPSQCGSVSSAISSMSNSSSGRISRASSSSSSGCLSDDNNAFDSEFTTGTIKRKPSMKPNLPLTTMTRQLKEVGEITICESGSDERSNASSPDRGGTLTRRHSRRKSQESNSSGTLKRRPPVAPINIKRDSTENSAPMAAAMTAAAAATAIATACSNSSSGGGSTSSSNSTPTPTPSICAKPLLDINVTIDLMCSSTLSLDSLPPPPPLVADEHDVYGSQLSLASLPPPPPPEEGMNYVTPAAGLNATTAMTALPNSNGALPPAVPAKPIKPAVKASTSLSLSIGAASKSAPPYKAPPDYVGPAALPQSVTTAIENHISNSNSNIKNSGYTAAAPITTQITTTTTTKKVSFADSPILLRRKMYSPEPLLPSRSSLNSNSNHGYQQQQQQQHHYNHYNQPIYSPGPILPPRTDLARPVSNASLGYTVSPKRLQESASNPPRDFLKDLQRVMRKKWQVAQKCKLEPATTPHEVLGFRDFNNEDLLAAHNLNSGGAGAQASSHYYRETANVSNWVQEHYGAGAAPPPPPPNEYALYENVHAQCNGTVASSDAAVVIGAAGGVAGDINIAEPPYGSIQPTGVSVAGGGGVGVGPAIAQQQAQAAAAAVALRKKRPPPPPPKRSDSTHLTHRI